MFTITDCQIVDNHVTTDGGALWQYNSTGTLSDTALLRNEADGQGGALNLTNQSDLTSTNCDWGTGGDDNVADDIYLPDSGLTYNYGAAASFSCDSLSCW